MAQLKSSKIFGDLIVIGSIINNTFQIRNNDLTAIADLTGTSGLLKKTASGVWTLDTTAYTTNLGTVTGVNGTGSVSGITLSGNITSSGNLVLGGTLQVSPNNFSSQVANRALMAPNGSNGVPTFRNLAAADIPNLDASKITSGIIDAARLPSYVDDALEFANLAAFPTTGEAGKLYVALDTNKMYRWSGSIYVYITSGAVDSVAGYTGVITLSNLVTALSNNFQGLDADLTSIAGLSGTLGLLKKTAANTWVLDTTAYTTNLGTVTSVSSGTSNVLNIATGSVTPVISINKADTTTDGYLSHIDWNTFNSKQNALGFTPYNATNPNGFINSSGVTFENLNTNGDIGTGSNQVSAGNHLHTSIYQALDADLTAIAALTGTSGILTKTAANTWALDTAPYGATLGVSGKTVTLKDKSSNVISAIITQDTVYTHPTGDGNLHVPANSTTNEGKVLTAGATAGLLTWNALTKSSVGLGNVNNTADTDKPISNAVQTALNLKSALYSPTFTGIPLAPTAASGTNTTQIATTAFVHGFIPSLIKEQNASLSIKEWIGTLAQYNAITTKDPNTKYVITDDSLENLANADTLDGLHALSFARLESAPEFTGNVTSPLFNGNLNGNANSASILSTSRNIAGVAFNGSMDINIPFANLINKPTTIAGYGITDAPQKIMIVYN